MVSLTFALEDDVFEELKTADWVNWSKIAYEELMKKEIFERYLKTKEVTDDDWEFCESIDWHPVDELPMKESFIKEMKKRRNEKGTRYSSVEELFNAISNNSKSKVRKRDF
jgi:hypothetical protein